MPRSFAILAPIFLLVGACSETPLEVEPSTSAPVDEPGLSSFLNGPDNPGASGVFRLQGLVIVISTDPARDVFALHGVDPEDTFACDGSGDYHLSDMQRVETVETVVHVLSNIKDSPIHLYRLSDPEPDFCTFLTDNWLYEGTHSLLTHDNNLDAFLNQTGANSFGWNGNGTVYDREGNRCKYQESQQAVWSPDRQTFKWTNEDIKVNCQGPE